LAEQLNRNQQVAGSSPIAGSTGKNRMLFTEKEKIAAVFLFQQISSRILHLNSELKNRTSLIRRGGTY
jgi:hypothetical protein